MNQPPMCSAWVRCDGHLYIIAWELGMEEDAVMEAVDLLMPIDQAFFGEAMSCMLDQIDRAILMARDEGPYLH